MGETQNISRMAELISGEIFSELFWMTKGPTNINWDCIIEEHKKNKHPTDVVFEYKNPYKNAFSYVLCDLKSYAKGSIDASNIAAAISSLNLTLECARESREWQDLYIQSGLNHTINGMLFIYNHDGEYDKNFSTLLKNAFSRVKISRGNKIYILSPIDICYLKTITNHIKTLRGDSIISSKSNCSFFYPSLSKERPAHAKLQRPCSLELIKSNVQILQQTVDALNNFFLFYRGYGDTREEFMYLFDYLCYYQIVENATSIEICAPYASPAAAAIFSSAKTDYIANREEDRFSDRINSIKFRPISNIVTQFSEIEIGMRYAE